MIRKLILILILLIAILSLSGCEFKQNNNTQLIPIVLPNGKGTFRLMILPINKE